MVMSLIRIFIDGPEVSFQRVAYSIAYDSRCMGRGPFTAIIAALDIFLSVIPGTTRVGPFGWLPAHQ